MRDSSTEKNRAKDRKGGHPPKDPVALFKALIWMLFQKQRSINWLAGQLRKDADLAAICGFLNGTPAVDTFYGFLMRLKVGGPPHREPRFHRRTKRVLKVERDENPDTGRGIVKKKVGIEEQAASDPLPKNFSTRLQDLLLEAGVFVSVAAGLLEGSLDILIDGSLIPSSAKLVALRWRRKRSPPLLTRKKRRRRRRKSRRRRMLRLPRKPRERTRRNRTK